MRKSQIIQGVFFSFGSVRRTGKVWIVVIFDRLLTPICFTGIKAKQAHVKAQIRLCQYEPDLAREKKKPDSEYIFFFIVKTQKQCCGSGMFFPDPNFSIQHPGSRVNKIPIPRSRSASKNFSIFNPKNCF